MGGRDCCAAYGTAWGTSGSDSPVLCASNGFCRVPPGEVKKQHRSGRGNTEHEPGDEAAQHVRIAFEPAGGYTQVSAVRPGSMRVAVPVQITGIPKGRQLSSERISITASSSGVPNWRSPWLETSEIATHTDWRNSDDWLAVDGLYWLSFDIPTNELDHLRSRLTDLRADVAFSLFTTPAITKLPAKLQA
jgi:hypothetical protein